MRSEAQTSKTLPTFRFLRSLKPRRVRSLQLECLEERRLLSHICWTNRNDPNNGFQQVFGAQAPIAIADIDYAILAWENVITNFNQPGGGDELDITISMAPTSTAKGAQTSVTAENQGDPTAASMTVFPGPDLNGDYLYLDPTPADSSEYQGSIINPFTTTAQSGSPAAGLNDLVTMVEHELGHALGMSNNFSDLKILNTPYFTNTGLPNGGSPGTLWVFKDGADEHLFTSDDAGQADLGFPVHTAGSTLFANFNGQTYYGTDDLMNPGSEIGARRFIPSWVALMFQDVYGYTIEDPSQMPTSYEMQNSDGSVLFRTSGDTNTISVDRLTIGFLNYAVVSVTIFDPGNGVDPNPTYVQSFSVPSDVAMSIQGHADDNINLNYVPVVSVVNIRLVGDAGSSGSDQLTLGSNSTVQEIYAPVSITADPGWSTQVTVNDTGDSSIHTVNVTNNAVLGLLPLGKLGYDQSALQSLTLNLGPESSEVNVYSTPNHDSPGTVTTNIISDGNAQVTVGHNGSFQGITGIVYVSNTGGYTSLNLDDSADRSRKNVIVTNGTVSGLSSGTVQYSQGVLSVFSVWSGEGPGSISIPTTPQNLFGVTTYINDDGSKSVVVGNNGLMQDIDGTLELNLMPGQDTLTLDDSKDLGQTTVQIDTVRFFTPVTYQRVQGLAPATIFFVTSGNVAATQIETGTAGNVTTVAATNLPLSLISHGPAHITIGNSNSSLQNIHGSVAIANPAGNTTLTILGNGDSTSDTVIVTNSSITGLAQAPITFNQNALLSLAILGPHVQSVYDVQGIPNHGAAQTVPTILETGSTDTVNVGSAGTLQDIKGQLYIENYAQHTILNLDDSRDTARRIVLVSGSSVTGLSSGSILFNQAILASLTIQAGMNSNTGDHETFNVQGTPNNSPTPGSLRTTIITHGDGTNFNVGNGYTSAILGDLYIQAAVGHNVVNVNNASDLIARLVTVGQHSDGGSLYTEVSFGAGRIDVADGGTSSLVVSGGSDTDGTTLVYMVNGTTPNTAVKLNLNSTATNAVDIMGNSGILTVNTHGRADVVNVGDASNTLDSIGGTINVNRGRGSVTLSINDQGESAAENYEIEPNVIQRGPNIIGQPYSPTQIINYSGVSSVVVNGGTASDGYGVGGSPSGTSLTVNGGTAFNEWLVADTAGNLDEIQGPLTLHSSSGVDLLEDYDYLNATSHTYTLVDQTVSRDGIMPIAGSGFGEIVLYTPTVGGSRVNVQSTSTETALTVIACTSGDQIVVGSPTGGGDHTLQSIVSQLSIESPAGSTASVILDDSGHEGTAGDSRMVTFSSDPTYGDMIVNGLAPAQISLPIGAGGNVTVNGYAGNDTFAINALPQGWNLNLDGEGGTNTLDYSGYTGDVTVNLGLGTATGLGTIRNIANVTGGNGNNALVGDTNANVLIGGTGRNILIGGSGADVLTGGIGDNILIGGKTDYDLTDAAIEALRDEWDRTDLDFNGRFLELENGITIDGVTYSLNSDTVYSDDETDTLNGGSGENWFFDSVNDPDTLNNEKDGDIITTI